VEIQCKELDANSEGIANNINDVVKQFTPVAKTKEGYLFDLEHDLGLLCNYCIHILKMSFQSAEAQYEQFVDQTAEYHAESMFKCLQEVCPDLLTTNFVNVNVALGERHGAAIEAFNKATIENKCEIIARNYGPVIFWCISRSHFNKKKFARQVKLDMNCEQDASTMHKRYIMSTVRRNSQYSKVSELVDSFIGHYERSRMAELKAEEDMRKRIDKAYDGLASESDKKVMDDIISAVEELKVD
jgi:hypothetical protein